MKTIQVSEKDFKKMVWLYDEFYVIYGNRDTVWDLDDLDDLQKIGQEFMEVFMSNIKILNSKKTIFK